MAEPVKLSEMLHAFDFQWDDTYYYVDRQTGEVVSYGQNEEWAVENHDDVERYPEWQKRSIRIAEAVFADDIGRFVPLPDNFEINEHDMMRRFGQSIDDVHLSAALQRAIRGKGAFRRFKDRVYGAGIAERWHAFRDDCYREVAAEWGQANGIELDVDS